jgi:hypothetical protein
MGIYSFLALFVVIVSTVGVLFFGQNFGLTPEFVKQYSNFSMIVIPFLAFVACLMSASKYDRADETKTAWIFVGLGSLSFCIAQVIFVFVYGQLDPNASTPPFPAWSDIFYLLSPLLMTYGLYNLRKSLRGVVSGLGSFLAIFVAVAAVIFALIVQWSSLVNPDTSSLAIVVTVLYELFDPIMLGFSVLALSMMLGGLVSRPWWMIIFALVIIYVGNIIFNITNINETYYIGHLVDVTWPLAFGLIFVAALWNREILR